MKQGQKSNQTLKSRRWSEHEIRKLSLARQMGADLPTMAKLLERTVPSVNKALTRLGVRQLGESPRGAKPGRRARSASIAYLSSQIEQEMETFASEESTFVGKKTKPCFAFLTKGLDETRLDPKLPLMVKDGVLMTYWRAHGVEANVYTFKGETLYRLGGHTLTPAQFLMQTNQKRQQQNEPVFWIEGITQL